jgi:hypothetical protein
MIDEGLASPDRADSIAMLMATQTPMVGRLTAEDIVIMDQMETSRYDGALT